MYACCDDSVYIKYSTCTWYVYMCVLWSMVYTLYMQCLYMYTQYLSAPQNGPALVHTSSSEGEESQHQLICKVRGMVSQWL